MKNYDLTKISPLTLAAILITSVCGFLHIGYCINYFIKANYPMGFYGVGCAIMCFTLCVINVAYAKKQAESKK